MKSENKVELLAPAGDLQGFFGAIYAGADAVYLAGKRFGARAYADNFTSEEIIDCIRYAHLMQRKVYLAVNTLIKEEEIQKLYDFLLPFYQNCIDGIIVQDFGVISYVKRLFPDMEIHASTQMSICTKEGADYLRKMGLSRIVPARELSLQELERIRKQVDIELETFIHGAMCYCYSGQCLFSSILGGRSGNRGRCAQPCRLPYTIVNDGKEGTEGYFLSLKDLCTIEHIPALIEAGIDSFKIEGRMKKAEYTAGVTALYRKYIDSYYILKEQYGIAEASRRYQVDLQDIQYLRTLYMRSEIQNGYYFRRNGKSMVSLTSPSYSGSDEALLTEIRNKLLNDKKRIPIVLNGEFLIGREARLHLSTKDHEVTVFGNVVENAVKQPITEDNIRKQISKLQDTAFWAERIEISLSDQAFYSLQKMNEMRREAVIALEETILSANGYSGKNDFPYKLNDTQIPALKKPSDLSVRISVRTLNQLEGLQKWFDKNDSILPGIIYIASDLAIDYQEKMQSILRQLPEKIHFYINLPYVLRESDMEYLYQVVNILTDPKSLFRGVLIHSVDQIGYMSQYRRKFRIHLDAGFYTWNTYAIEALNNLADSFCIPYELKASEQLMLLDQTKQFEKIVYSRIPMMISSNCVLRTSLACHSHSAETVLLKDRYGKYFPVLCDCRHCTNIIFNSVPFSLHKEIRKWRERCNTRIDFTIESKDEVEKLLDTFLMDKPYPYKEYTTGHEKRGVE